MTETVTYKQLRRSRSDRMIAGVSGGLGRYFDVNPVLYRVGFVVLALLGGAGILIYMAAALVIPDEGTDESIVEQALRERVRRPWRLLGLVLVAISSFVLLAEFRFWDDDFAWVIVLAAGLVLLTLGPRLWTEVTGGDGPAVGESGGGGGGTVGAEQPPPAAQPPPPARSFPIGTAVLGLLVVAAGVLAIVAAAGVDVPWAVALAVAAGAVGVAVVVGAFLRLRVGWLIVLGGLLGAAAILASTINLRLGDGVGDRSYAPATVADLDDPYRLGIGELNLDLSRLELEPGITNVVASVGIGHLLVTVPPDVAVHVDSDVDWGDSDVLGSEKNGHDVEHEVDRPGREGAPLLELDLGVGAGQVEVRRAVR
jgi:phage shock protein PspC (stress-responsive transcriptional regulator)